MTLWKLVWKPLLLWLGLCLKIALCVTLLYEQPDGMVELHAPSVESSTLVKTL